MLRILPRYFIRELMKAFIYAFIAVLLIIFVSFALQTMLSRGINIFRAPKVVLYLLLQAFPYALPTALLASVIMTYGRFSGDNEILAIRSSGIHLQWVTTPTVLLGTFCSLITLFVSGNLLPATEAKLRKLKDETLRMLVEQLGTGRESISFSGWEIFVGQKEGSVLKEVLVANTSSEAVTQVYWAKEGALSEIGKTRVFQLELRDVKSARFTAEDPSEFHWMKIEKGVVPLVLGGRSDSSMDKPEYYGFFKLIRERNGLQEEVRKHSEHFPNPRKAMLAFSRGMEELRGEIRLVSQDIEKGNEAVQKLRKGEEDARREAASWTKQAEETQPELQQRDAEKKDLEQKIAGTNAEIEAKQQALQKIASKGEATTPEDKQQFDSLTREKAGLEASLEQFKAETVKLAAQIVETQRKHKDLKQKAGESLSIASKLAALIIKTDEEVTASNDAKKERETALKEKARMREEAKRQELLYDMRALVNERLALAFSPLAFVLIAIPLGIMCRHGHILVGFSIGIGLLLVYYALFTAGRVLAASRYFYMEPCYWAADACLACVGILLLARIFAR